MSDVAFLAELGSVLPADAVLREGPLYDAARRDYLKRYSGAALALLLPRSTQEVAASVAAAVRHGVAIVPQGGNTGLVGGSVPAASGRNVVLSLSRMRAIRSIDPRDSTLIAEAGVTLAEVQAAAAGAGRLFPLSLGSEGHCQVGGVISTNAGGHSVLRYGNTRELLLGVEAVLADGRVVSRLRGLRKDNTGYDLKQLFCGAEGTLGVVTAAALRLFPAQRQRQTALLACPSIDAVMASYDRLTAEAGEFLSAFELLPRSGLELVARHVPAAAAPLALDGPWYVLVEASSGSSRLGLAALLQDLLADLLQEGLASDALLATSEAQRSAFWRTREAIVDAQNRHGPGLKHDIAVPLSRIPALLTRGSERLLEIVPDGLIVAFGHVGDGNIHFNLLHDGPSDDFRQRFLAPVAEALYGLVEEMGGSISAEHGVGVARLPHLLMNRRQVELDVMRQVKDALDPQGLLNPGKVVPPARS